jgi:hypothetical protein
LSTERQISRQDCLLSFMTVHISLSLHLYYHALVVGDDVVVFGVVFHIMHANVLKDYFTYLH